jgi:hypothetical protein
MSIAALAAPREIRSVSIVMAMIAAVPSSATKPIKGWNRNSPIRKTGIHGISRNAVGPMPDMKVRT